MKTKFASSLLTVFALQLVWAVAALLGLVTLQAGVQTAAVCTGELVFCTGGATFLHRFNKEDTKQATVKVLETFSGSKRHKA